MAPSVNENRNPACKMHLSWQYKKNKGLCCMVVGAAELWPAREPFERGSIMLDNYAITLLNCRRPFSKACKQHSQTVIQPCMWFMEEASQLVIHEPNSIELNLFHHRETTYRVGRLPENAAGML